MDILRFPYFFLVYLYFLSHVEVIRANDWQIRYDHLEKRPSKLGDWKKARELHAMLAAKRKGIFKWVQLDLLEMRLSDGSSILIIS